MASFNCKIIAGRTSTMLGESIAKTLNVQLIPVKFSDFSNSEMNVQLLDNIRGVDIFIIQTGSIVDDFSVNDMIMELFLLTNACKLASAKSISVIMPLLPYSRADKKDLPRTPIGGRLVPDTLKQLGVNRLISMDLHSGQIQGFVDLPFDNLYAKNTLCTYLLKHYLKKNKDNCVLISPDVGGAKRIDSYAQTLGLPHIIMHKQRDYSSVSKVVKSIIVGDVSEIAGKTAIIVDDIIDTMGTMVMAAEELKNVGFARVIIVATHGVLSGSISIDRINGSDIITDVIVTNTIDQTKNKLVCPKLKVVDTSLIFSEVISRLLDGRSISELF